MPRVVLSTQEGRAGAEGQQQRAGNEVLGPHLTGVLTSKYSRKRDNPPADIIGAFPQSPLIIGEALQDELKPPQLQKSTECSQSAAAIAETLPALQYPEDPS